MDRGTWQATVHGVARVGHDLATRERERILPDTKEISEDTELAGWVDTLIPLR